MGVQTSKEAYRCTCCGKVERPCGCLAPFCDGCDRCSAHCACIQIGQEVPAVFAVRDSGQRTEFDSGMVRDTNDGKTLFHLVYDGPMLLRWAMQLTAGARKYAVRNWMKAEGKLEWERFRESAARHFAQWINGETDEDHAAAVFFNINGAEYVKAKLGS
jgi:hypothetical protein